MSERNERHLGLYGATALGVGAIVGGGILALAGVAFATAGAAAIVAFALNGGIAFLTAVSFARLARRFPESGGTYTYAKRVLSIEVAFVVGWVVWFASIVAGVLYALGFAAFSVEGLLRLLPGLAESWSWMGDGRAELLFALAAIGVYSWLLVERTAGGGNAATVGKVIVFVVLLGGGAWAWARRHPRRGAPPSESVRPGGLARRAAGDGVHLHRPPGVRSHRRRRRRSQGPAEDPCRARCTSPSGSRSSSTSRSSSSSPRWGRPRAGSTPRRRRTPRGSSRGAAERYMGAAGYWLVIGAGLLSMLSALHANLYGASRVAFSMARDRTLPRRVGEMRGRTGTPAIAVVTTGAMMAVIALAVGNVAAAGAASSLIFLVSFAMVHCTAILAQRRGGDLRLPLIPVAGAVLCVGLAIFQAVAVPEAGRVAVLWLGVGVVLYLMALAPGARLADASAEARDPDLARSRGRSPLVLAPIANPASAASLTDMAATVCTPNVGRVLLLSVLRGDAVPDDAAIRDAQDILSESMGRSLESPTRPETLFTIATDVWGEIARVADLHRCETVLVGLPRITEPGVEARLEGLISNIEADVVIVRAPPRWRISEATRILVPVGGRSAHSHLRARLLASLSRSSAPTLTFVRALPPGTGADSRRRFESVIDRLARDEAAGPYRVELEFTDDPVACIARRAEANDLVVMGMENRGRERPSIGPFVLEVARKTTVPLILLGRRADAGSFAARGIAQAVSTIQRPIR